MKQTGVDDLVMLTEIKEDKIVANLKKRYSHDLIYVGLYNANLVSMKKK